MDVYRKIRGLRAERAINKILGWKNDKEYYEKKYRELIKNAKRQIRET